MVNWLKDRTTSNFRNITPTATTNMTLNKPKTIYLSGGSSSSKSSSNTPKNIIGGSSTSNKTPPVTYIGSPSIPLNFDINKMDFSKNYGASIAGKGMNFFAFNPLQSKLNLKLNDERIKAQYEKDLFMIKQEQDFFKNSWYEKLGISSDSNEQYIQDLLRQQQYYETAGTEGTALKEVIISNPQVPTYESESFFDKYKTFILIGGVVLAFFMIKGKK